ncbi:hypothetical protein CROQUDRAFT_101031 [Cronartium quercuum f. sp. fusiforme G11]|uniref:Uncharacterized protein n=1 Tax=Cronartium quercuum f. sp. fusiforme G11 TaxID=708437 RepID=A0A9P6N6K7_9BASI|nr:hypothetical protein CROQUDRAFT_101031 [Cronartium quercuum f. sp. fusiforme G11]
MGMDIKYFCNGAGTAVASSRLPNVLIFELSGKGTSFARLQPQANVSREPNTL